MATVTNELVSFHSDIARVEVDYDDTTTVISAVRVINRSADNLRVTVERLSDGLTRSAVLAPGTHSLILPTNPPSLRMRYILIRDSQNRLLTFDGVAVNCVFPA